MSISLRLFLIVPAIALLAIFAPTPALTHAATKTPVIGIADQKPEFLSDPTFLGLGVRHARLAVAWDAMTTDWQVAQLDAWMNAARGAGIEPLVTFDISRLPGRSRTFPSPAQLQAQFRAFRARYPWVRNFSAWNEPNHLGVKPELVARYYQALKRSCKACRVLGADLVDLPSTPKWVRRFVKVAGQPNYWGFHNYVTANRFQTSRVTSLLRATRGQIWLTETGGLVAKRNNGVRLPQGKSHAAKVTRFLLRDLPRLSRRITRVYLYQWDTSSSSDTWDSGLVSHDGVARPALGILKQTLAAARKPL